MKAILFDWDGTLIDTAEHVFEANVEVIKSIGLPPLSRELYGLHYSPNWRRMYAALGVPEHLVEGAAEIWHGAYRGHEAELLPGARPALERLVAAGIPIGVVTAGDRKVVSGQLKRTGVADLLGSVVYGDDITEQKPDPEPLRRGLRLVIVVLELILRHRRRRRRRRHIGERGLHQRLYCNFPAGRAAVK
jgi:beta-phosphoglucomutase-like phosphatase (HAD superfamily)